MDESSSIVRAFHTFGECIDYAEGASIYTVGNPGDSCLFLEEGIVRVQLDHEDLDSDGVLRFVEPGEILGELTMLDSNLRSASAYAETHVRAKKLTQHDLKRMHSENPDLAFETVAELGRIASSKLRQLTKSYASVAYKQRDEFVNETVEKAQVAQKQFESWPDSRVEDLLIDLAEHVVASAKEYAEKTVVCTRVGNAQDKAIKNRFACLGTLGEILKKEPIANPDGERKGVLPIPSACGVVFGVIPMTSPVATAIFKILIALQARDSIILSPHRAALPICKELALNLQAVLDSHGAPQGIVSWVLKRTDRRRTNIFMAHEGVSLVLATGGKMLVEAAYASGTPAYGVGPGNAPVLIASDANTQKAADFIVRSKSFDNGLICGAENNLVVHEDQLQSFKSDLIAAGAAIVDHQEQAQLLKKAVLGTHHLSPEVVGKDAATIASLCGILRDYPIRLLIVPQELPAARTDNRLAKEKLAPLLSLFTVESDEAGIELSKQLLSLDGQGHTAIIHSSSDVLAEHFAREVSASRILVNTPAVQGIFGATTGLMPSLTLGCGTFGGNATTDNINHRHLINVKRLAFHSDEGEAMMDSMDHVNPAATILSRVLGFEAPEQEASGCIIRDSQGKEYLDFLAGVGVMNVGHRHPHVIESVKKQMDKMPFTSRVMLNPLQAKLAKRLSALAPGDLRYSFFSNSGTESVEAALKIARFSTGRSQIIGTNNAFHGKTYGSLSASGRDIFKTPFTPLVPGFSHVPFGDVNALSKEMNQNVAAVILEPIQGEGGINVSPEGYLESVRSLCSENGALLILDEVQTGMGRCGSMFVCEQHNVEPDLLCLAKGLSGGVMPIGVTMGTNEVWTIFEENAFLHSTTFGGNPLACTAAMATLDVIESEALCENAARMGDYLQERLNQLKKEFPNLIQDVRGRGLLIGVEFLEDAVCARIISGLVDHGVIAGYTLNQPKVIRLEPPLIVSKEQCDQALLALRHSIQVELAR